jgi:hypothetical protein
MLCPHCGRSIQEAVTTNDALAEPWTERDTRKKYRPGDTPLEKNDEFIENLARFADGTLSEAAIKLKYHLNDEDWAALGGDDKLVERIEAAKLRRIRAGTTKRERAQIEVAEAPPILGTILRNHDANERHRIDAAKALDAMTGGPETTPPAERFHIVINLGADEKLVIDKPIRPGPDDSKVIDQELLPMIAADKRTEGGDGGEPI